MSFRHRCINFFFVGLFVSLMTSFEGEWKLGEHLSKDSSIYILNLEILDSLLN